MISTKKREKYIVSPSGSGFAEFSKNGTCRMSNP
jgi:hypothetical protein